MKALILILGLCMLTGCPSYSYNGAFVRPGGWGGGGWGHYGGGWGHNNVAVINHGGGFYHPGRW